MSEPPREWTNAGLWRILEAIKDDPDTLQWFAYTLIVTVPNVPAGEIGEVRAAVNRRLRELGREPPQRPPWRPLRDGQSP